MFISATVWKWAVSPERLVYKGLLPRMLLHVSGTLKRLSLVKGPCQTLDVRLCMQVLWPAESFHLPKSLCTIMKKMTHE